MKAKRHVLCVTKILVDSFILLAALSLVVYHNILREGILQIYSGI